MWCGYTVLWILAALPQGTPGEITILNPQLHQFEDGPPVYADHTYIPGETVFFSCQVKGFRVARNGEQEKVLLSYRIEAKDSTDVPVVEPHSGKVDESLSPQDKDWLPKIRYSFVLPPHAPAGVYRIALAVKDELGGQEKSTQIKLTVRGRQVAPSESLAIRNFRFLRSEDETAPLPRAAYRPGETMWAKFDITGYKIGEKNHVWVEYGLSILNADGKVLYSQPEGAVEQDTPFYPKRFVPGVVSLNIQPGTTAAEYGLQLTVRDRVGQQTIESRHTFRVE